MFSFHFVFGLLHLFVVVFFLFLDCPACILLIVFTNLLGLRPSWRVAVVIVVVACLKRGYYSCVCVFWMLLALYFGNVRNAKRFLFFPNFACFCFHSQILPMFFFLCAFFIIITIVVVVVTFAASDIFVGAFNSFLNKSNNVSASKFKKDEVFIPSRYYR